MTGYLEGNLTEPDGIELLLSTARESLAVAAELDCPRLNLHGTGLDGPIRAFARGRAVRFATGDRPVRLVRDPTGIPARPRVRRAPVDQFRRRALNRPFVLRKTSRPPTLRYLRIALSEIEGRQADAMFFVLSLRGVSTTKQSRPDVLKSNGIATPAGSR